MTDVRCAWHVVIVVSLLLACSAFGQAMDSQAVTRTMAMDSEVAVIRFARNGTKHPGAIVVVNISKWNRGVASYGR